MSLQRVCEEVVRPFLQSIGHPTISTRLEQLVGLLREQGLAVQQIAISCLPEDLTSTGLPSAVVRELAKALREDALPRSTVNGDSLRPQSFDQVIGHASFKQLMLRSILASKRRDEPMAHILLTGPRGLGKTTLALAIGHERGANIRLFNGTQFLSAADCSAQVLQWQDGDIIFIDEIHGMHKTAQETLYSVMEDRRLPVSEKRRSGNVVTSIPAPRITIIGATTNPANLLGPFRNRFSVQYTLTFYSEEEMMQIGQRSTQVLGMMLRDPAMRCLTQYARNNPRTLNSFLKQLSDQAVAENRQELSMDDVTTLMLLNGFDEDALLPFERNYLVTLETQGKTASLKTLADALDLDTKELEETVEPWLIRQGFVRKTPRGRHLLRSHTPTNQE